MSGRVHDLLLKNLPRWCGFCEGAGRRQHKFNGLWHRCRWCAGTGLANKTLAEVDQGDE